MVRHAFLEHQRETLEKSVDYLSLMTGRKFEVPYDALTVFSTNIAPKKLVDDAAESLGIVGGLSRPRHDIHSKSTSSRSTAEAES